jgi:hypothetical protein
MRRPASLALLALLLAGCGSAPADVRPQPAAAQPEQGWSTAAPSLLSPRHSVPAVTVGDEVLFLGGDSSPLCPPAARYVDPAEPQRDGAAYDPATDRWRHLAPAPVPPSPGSTAVVGDVVHLLAEGTFARYDVGTDTWTSLPAPPDPTGLLAAVGDRVVRYAATQEGGQVTADHVYDPATRIWRPLPRDPLAPAFDRAVVWTGSQIVLVGKRVPPPPADGETWTAVPQRDQVIGFGTQYSWTKNRVLSPYVFDDTAGGTNPGGRPEPTCGLLDLRTGQWDRLPPPPATPRDGLCVAASSPDLVTAGAGLVLDVAGGECTSSSLRPARTTRASAARGSGGSWSCWPAVGATASLAS